MIIRPPRIMSGPAAERVDQMQRYLYQLVEQLNNELNGLATSGPQSIIGGSETAIHAQQTYATIQALTEEIDSRKRADEVFKMIVPYGAEQSAALHNSIYRGKLLGSFDFIVDFYDFMVRHKVSDGLFDDMWIGDKIELLDGTLNKTWVIAGFDWYLGKEISDHHIVLISENPFGNYVMNHNNTTAGGYESMALRHTLDDIYTPLVSLIGNYYCNPFFPVSNNIDINGHASGSNYVQIKLGTLTEPEVFGFARYGNRYDYGLNDRQFPYFRLCPAVNLTRHSYWIRSIASENTYAFVSSGNLFTQAVGNTAGIRPILILKAS